MNLRGNDEVVVKTLELSSKLKSVKIGTKSQKLLSRSGDDRGLYLSHVGHLQYHDIPLPRSYDQLVLDDNG